MIMKFLLLAAVIYLVYIVFFKKSLPKASKKADKVLSDDDFIECETCHTYTAVGDMIVSNGKYYCSKKCLKEAK